VGAFCDRAGFGLLGKVPIKKAIGSSLLIISANAIAGLLGYLGRVSLDWSLTVTFTFLAALGTVLGGYLAQYVEAKNLQKAFGYFLLGVAAFVLFQNRPRSSSSTSFVPTSNYIRKTESR
jgi:Domain of unknown function DUF81.